MRLEYHLAAAMLLDACLGDPRWLPHPVRGIGRLAAWWETRLRPCPGWEKSAGLLAVAGVLAITGGSAWALLRVAGVLHPWAADAVAIGLIYASVAAHDLAFHSRRVQGALLAGKLAQARRRVSCLVGRDTQTLGPAEVTRAAVESVAESTVDGVTAPMFFALLGGPVGAILYRAVNTLDSLFGHRNQRYERFGWAAAKLDDLANWLPARLTAPLVGLSALCLGRDAGGALRVLRRDGRKHASPNAGLTEAAMAGALGVRLGGLNYYAGEAYVTPALGEARCLLTSGHIAQANALMRVTAAWFLILGILARVGIELVLKSAGLTGLR